MALGCNAGGAEASLLADLAGYTDCSAQALGKSGFAQSGFGAGLPAGLLATCLTIYVALLAYRLLLREAFDARGIVLAAVRVGVVATFCLSWPSFEQVIYRVAIDGPAEIATRALGGANSDLRAIGARAQHDYEAVQFDPRNGAAPVGPNVAPLQSQLQPGLPPTAPMTPTQPSRPVTLPGALFLASAGGGLIAARLAAGLLLAVGPLIIALGLFDSGLGLVEGWLRALAGMTLASASLMVTSLLELDFVDARIAAPPPDTLSPQGLMVIGIIFSVVTLVMIIASGTAGRGVRLSLRAGEGRAGATAILSRPAVSDAMPRRARPDRESLEPASRAQSIADAVASQARREEMARNAEAGGDARRRSVALTGRGVAGNDGPGRPTPLGHSLRRTPRARNSASVTRRESRQ